MHVGPNQDHLLITRSHIELVLVLTLFIKHVHLQVRYARPHRAHVHIFVVLFASTHLFGLDVIHLVLMKGGNTAAAGLREKHHEG